MTNKYVKAIKDELKHKITVNRQYRSFEKQVFANGLQQALDIIEKYERRDMRGKEEKGELANEVWNLYEKHHSHLATHVYEFGDELKELLSKYQKGGAE